jgi:hypothetical protein
MSILIDSNNYFLDSFLNFRQRDPALHDYLNICLRNKYEMVALEAARAICTLKTSDPKEIGATVSILQLMLTSHKPTVRFAAVKTLNMVLFPIANIQTIVDVVFLNFKRFDNLFVDHL